MYGYGYRYNSGLVVGAGGGAPFVNTYSLDFDGVDDYVGLGTISALNGGVSAFSTSVWFKYNGVPSTSKYMLLSGGTGVTDRVYIQLIATDTIRYAMGGGFNDVNVGTLTSGTWYNLITVQNGLDIDIYLNGTLKGSFTDQVPTSNFATTIKIGNYISGSYWWNGLIDEVSLYDRVLTPTEITSISAAPTDLTDLSPTVWLRNGDNGSYKSPQWLIPNNENKDKVSNYSYQFEGINSREMSVGTVNVGTTNITSMWLKRNVVSTQQTLLGGSSATFPDYYMLLFLTNDFYVRYSPMVVIGWQQALVKAIFNNTTDWINIVVVRNGDTVKLHLNGDDAGITPDFSSGGAIGALDTQFKAIGADTGGINPTNGTVNNIATWDVDTVLPSDIYNGGTPPDLTTLSTAPVNWWKMGQDATFVYNVGGNGTFTVPDQVGSNDGTAVTLIEDRVGFAPSSENNAVTINMDFVDVVPDTP